ncbi:fimbria/pilus periplasmic chaperone [Paraburkholderia sp. LEh10]|uniref:fimbrial biogenesis chaperone n=1 Tax=Paraburkholderia sp. LEh10 TaxID=2821353 RepID=UPI001AE4613D|nr:fimbria/pilus periplasmic chaperone [Paraburkholderia sp. LEh10]MBP0592717.1 fimbria/pilus periplasmic chaperone [Paraburkholderia sp. LEh10]
MMPAALVRWTAAVLAGSIAAGGALASVTIGGTRVIYPLDEREVTVKLTNDSKNPSLVQVWMDGGDANANPDDSAVPFVITPPIFRMDPKKSQTLRVINGGEALRQDRETVYWLNVLDIPPKAAARSDVNTLQIAYRTRIKVFARPPDLPGSPDDAPRQIAWKIVSSADGAGQSLALSNPTAFHVSYSKIAVSANGRTFENARGGMVAPYSKEIVPMPAMDRVHSGRVRYTAISDFGGAIEGDADIVP